MGLNAMYGILGHLPENFIIAFNTGQAFSGIFMNVIRYLTLYFYFSSKLTPEENMQKQFYESLIYYSISALISFISLIFCFIIYEDKFFQQKLKNSEEFKNIKSIEEIRINLNAEVNK